MKQENKNNFWIAYTIENYGYTKRALEELEIFHGIKIQMHDLVKITKEEVKATLKEKGY